MIYFAQLPTGSIKIGYSADVSARMKQLRAHYGVEPALLFVMKGGRDAEREMHERFSAHRLGQTEQFRPAPELMAFIDRPLLVNPNPDAVEATDVSRGHRLTIASIRLSKALAEWLEAVHRKTHIPKAVIVRLALALWGEQNGQAPFPAEDDQ